MRIKAQFVNKLAPVASAFKKHRFAVTHISRLEKSCVLTWSLWKRVIAR